MSEKLVRIIKVYIGTAAERAAMSTSGLAAGSTFEESDTGALYKWDGAAWFSSAKESVTISSTTAEDIGTPTCSKVTVAATTTQILAANTNRIYLQLTNNNQYDVWVKFGAAAVVGEGFLLKAYGGCYTATKDSIYQGAISGIGDGGSNDIAYVEGAST